MSNPIGRPTEEVDCFLCGRTIAKSSSVREVVQFWASREAGSPGPRTRTDSKTLRHLCPDSCADKRAREAYGLVRGA